MWQEFGQVMITRECAYCHETFTCEGRSAHARKYCPDKACAALHEYEKSHRTTACVCKDCGSVFTASTESAMYCKKCRVTHTSRVKVGALDDLDDSNEPETEAVEDAPIPEVPIVLPEAVRLAVEPKVGRLAMGARCRGCKSPLFWHDNVLCTACQIVQYRTGRDIAAIKVGVLV